MYHANVQSSWPICVYADSYIYSYMCMYLHLHTYKNAYVFIYVYISSIHLCTHTHPDKYLDGLTLNIPSAAKRRALGLRALTSGRPKKSLL